MGAARPRLEDSLEDDADQGNVQIAAASQRLDMLDGVFATSDQFYHRSQLTSVRNKLDDLEQLQLQRLCWLLRAYERARRLGTTDEERNGPLRLTINRFEYLITHLPSGCNGNSSNAVLFESRTAQGEPLHLLLGYETSQDVVAAINKLRERLKKRGKEATAAAKRLANAEAAACIISTEPAQSLPLLLEGPVMQANAPATAPSLPLLLEGATAQANAPATAPSSPLLVEGAAAQADAPATAPSSPLLMDGGTAHPLHLSPPGGGAGALHLLAGAAADRAAGSRCKGRAEDVAETPGDKARSSLALKAATRSKAQHLAETQGPARNAILAKQQTAQAPDTALNQLQACAAAHRKTGRRGQAAVTKAADATTELLACSADVIDASSPDAKQRIERELNVLGFAVVKVDGLLRVINRHRELIDLLGAHTSRYGEALFYYVACVKRQERTRLEVVTSRQRRQVKVLLDEAARREARERKEQRDGGKRQVAAVLEEVRRRLQAEQGEDQGSQGKKRQATKEAGRRAQKKARCDEEEGERSDKEEQEGTGGEEEEEEGEEQSVCITPGADDLEEQDLHMLLPPKLHEQAAVLFAELAAALPPHARAEREVQGGALLAFGEGSSTPGDQQLHTDDGAPAHDPDAHVPFSGIVPLRNVGSPLLVVPGSHYWVRELAREASAGPEALAGGADSKVSSKLKRMGGATKPVRVHIPQGCILLMDGCLVHAGAAQEHMWGDALRAHLTLQLPGKTFAQAQGNVTFILERLAANLVSSEFARCFKPTKQ